MAFDSGANGALRLGELFLQQLEEESSYASMAISGLPSEAKARR